MRRYSIIKGAAVGAVITIVGLSACEREGPAERAGEQIDRGVERAGESLERAGDRVQDRTDR